MSEPVLSLRGVTRTYVTDAGRLPVLKGVDLDVMPGEIVGLIGPSGSGKSSLLHAAGLLERPDGGRSRSPARTARSWATAAHPHAAGQHRLRLPVPPPAARVQRPRERGHAGDDRGQVGPWAGERAETLLTRLGLAERLHHQPAQLSGGEQQRVALARALTNEPRLLLADEPTGNLDPDTAETVFQALFDLARDTGVAALIATHNMELARYMDRVFALKDGLLEERTAGF
jgi:lipoprotein-releasing system ATP-binding protein